MFNDLVQDLAAEMGLFNVSVALIDVTAGEILNTLILQISKEGHVVSALTYQFELDQLQAGIHCERLEIRIRLALSRLRLLLEP